MTIELGTRLESFLRLALWVYLFKEVIIGMVGGLVKSIADKVIRVKVKENL